MAVAYWSKALAVETEKVVQANRENLMQSGRAGVERHMQHAIGHEPRGLVYAVTSHR